jgi:hypothetical protein
MLKTIRLGGVDSWIRKKILVGAYDNEPLCLATRGGVIASRFFS